MKNDRNKQKEKLEALVKHIQETLENDFELDDMGNDEYLKRLALEFARTQKEKTEDIKLSIARKHLIEENSLLLNLIWTIGHGAMFQSHIIRFFEGIVSKNTIISQIRKMNKVRTTDNFTIAGSNIILLKYSALQHVTKEENPDTVKFDSYLHRKCGYLAEIALRKYETFEYKIDKLAEFKNLSPEDKLKKFLESYQKGTTITKAKDSIFIPNCIAKIRRARNEYDRNAPSSGIKIITLNNLDAIINRFENEIRFQEYKTELTRESLLNVRKPQGQLKKLSEKKEKTKEDMQTIEKLKKQVEEGKKSVEEWTSKILTLPINKANKATKAQKEQIGDTLSTLRNQNAYIESLKVEGTKIIVDVAIIDFLDTLSTTSMERKILNIYNFLLFFFNIDKNTELRLVQHFKFYVSDDIRVSTLKESVKEAKSFLQGSPRNLPVETTDSITTESINAIRFLNMKGRFNDIDADIINTSPLKITNRVDTDSDIDSVEKTAEGLI